MGEIYSSFFKIYGALVRLTGYHIKVQHSGYHLSRYLPDFYLFICTFYVGENYSPFSTHGVLLMPITPDAKYTGIYIIYFAIY